MQGIQKLFLSLFVLFLFVGCDSVTVHNGGPVGHTWPMPEVQSPTDPGQTITDGGSPTAATHQSIVSGSVSVEGYQSGSVDVLALEASACDKGYCAIEGKPPLASTKLAGQGYFSLVVPHYGQSLVLKGTHLSPDQKTYQAQLYLGVLGQRKDDATLILKVE